MTAFLLTMLRRLSSELLARVNAASTSHVAATQPRHWRECVLWMRLAGYDIELIPYREWMDILRETSGAENPLQSLRSFFLHPIRAEDNLTLPELFEDGRRTQVSDARTREALSMLGQSSQALTTELLSRYFDDYERSASCQHRSPAARSTDERARSAGARGRPAVARAIAAM